MQDKFEDLLEVFTTMPHVRPGGHPTRSTLERDRSSIPMRILPPAGETVENRGVKYRGGRGFRSLTRRQHEGQMNQGIGGIATREKCENSPG